MMSGLTSYLRASVGLITTRPLASLHQSSIHSLPITKSLRIPTKLGQKWRLFSQETKWVLVPIGLVCQALLLHGPKKQLAHWGASLQAIALWEIMGWFRNCHPGSSFSWVSPPKWDWPCRICSSFVCGSHCVFSSPGIQFPFQSVAVGGLGHLGVKYARAMGCTTTAITSWLTPERIEEIKKLGADFVITMKELDQYQNNFDSVLNTNPSGDKESMDSLVDSVVPGGKLVEMGIWGNHRRTQSVHDQVDSRQKDNRWQYCGVGGWAEGHAEGFSSAGNRAFDWAFQMGGVWKSHWQFGTRETEVPLHFWISKNTQNEQGFGESEFQLGSLKTKNEVKNFKEIWNNKRFWDFGETESVDSSMESVPQWSLLVIISAINWVFWRWGSTTFLRFEFGSLLD